MLRQWINRINWRGLASVALALVMLAGLVSLMSFIRVKSSEQACTEVKIIVLGEESFIEQQDIASTLTEQYGELPGRTLESIPIHDMEQHLQQIPFVLSAMVTADMDGTVTVRIRQREAVLRVINGKGSTFYVDQQGLKMPVSLKYVPRVPVVNGYIAETFEGGRDSIRTQVVRDCLRTARFISRDSLWSSQIVQLYVNPQQDIELIPRVGRQQIILGDGDSLERKFEKLMLFYTKIVPRTGIDAYKTVNLKFAGQLVCERSDKYRPELLQKQDTTHQHTSNSNNTQAL